MMAAPPPYPPPLRRGGNHRLLYSFKGLRHLPSGVLHLLSSRGNKLLPPLLAGGGRGGAATLLTFLLFQSPAVAWELGHSGLHVTRSPQSLIVTRVDANSAAILAHVPAPKGHTVRLLYVNGDPSLDLLNAGKLETAFGSSSVLVTLGVREANALNERLEGPFLLDLVDTPEHRAKRMLAAREWPQLAKLAESGTLDPEATEAAWSRLALEANEAAQEDDWKQALGLASLVPSGTVAYRDLAPKLTKWRMAATLSAQEDRRLLAREHHHAGPNPHHYAAARRDRQSARMRKDRRS